MSGLHPTRPLASGQQRNCAPFQLPPSFHRNASSLVALLGKFLILLRSEEASLLISLRQKHAVSLPPALASPKPPLGGLAPHIYSNTQHELSSQQSGSHTPQGGTVIATSCYSSFQTAKAGEKTTLTDGRASLSIN